MAMVIYDFQFKSLSGTSWEQSIIDFDPIKPKTFNVNSTKMNRIEMVKLNLWSFYLVTYTSNISLFYE